MYKAEILLRLERRLSRDLIAAFQYLQRHYQANRIRLLMAVQDERQ